MVLPLQRRLLLLVPVLAARAGARAAGAGSAPLFQVAAAPGSSQVRRDWLPQQQGSSTTHGLSIDMVRGEQEGAQLVVHVPASTPEGSTVGGLGWEVGKLQRIFRPSGRPSAKGVFIPAADILVELQGFTFGGPCPFDSHLRGGCSGETPWHCGLGSGPTLNDSCVSWEHTVRCVGCCGSPAHPLRQNTMPYHDPLGWWPYPLLDWVRTFSVQRGAAQPILVTVATHPATLAGVYQALVNVTSADSGGGTRSIPLTVRVHDVVLPAEQTTVSLWGTEVSECKGAFANAAHVAPCNDTGMQELLLDHRMPAGSGIYHGMWASNMENSTAYPDNIGRLRSLWERGQRQLVVGALTDCQMNTSHCQGPRLGLTARLGWMMRAADAAMAAGWPQENLMIYVMDELGPEHIHGIWAPMLIAPKARALLPRAKIVACGDGAFSVAQENGGVALRPGGILEDVDLFIPRMPTYANTSADVLASIRSANKTIGWYTSGIPQGDFALNLFTEYSPIRARILLGAAAQKYAADAFLYYATNGWSQYSQGPTWSWTNISDTMNVQYMRQENATYDGQGQLIIPASPKSRYRGYAATMQLEGVRDGLEDRALYIKLEGLLSQARNTVSGTTRAMDAAARALEVPSAVLRSLTEGTEPGYIANERYFTEDPEALRSHWLDVVKAIQGLEHEASVLKTDDEDRSSTTVPLLRTSVALRTDDITAKFIPVTAATSDFTPPQPPCPGPDWWEDNGVCFQGCASNSQKRNPETRRCQCGEAAPNSDCLSFGASSTVCCAGQCADGPASNHADPLHSGACDEGPAALGTTNWGASFLVVFVIGSALYTFGGVALGHRVHPISGGIAQSSRSGRLQVHPHYQRWIGVASLVTDGVAFTRGQKDSKTPTLLHRHTPGEPAPTAKTVARKVDGQPQVAPKSVKKSSNRPKSKSKSKRSTATLNEQLLLGGNEARDKQAAPAESVGGKRSTPSGGGGQWVHVTD